MPGWTEIPWPTHLNTTPMNEQQNWDTESDCRDVGEMAPRVRCRLELFVDSSIQPMSEIIVV